MMILGCYRLFERVIRKTIKRVLHSAAVGCFDVPIGAVPLSNLGSCSLKNKRQALLLHSP